MYIIFCIISQVVSTNYLVIRKFLTFCRVNSQIILGKCQKMAKHTQNNSSAIAGKLFECFWPFCEIGALRVNNCDSLITIIIGKLQLSFRFILVFCLYQNIQFFGSRGTKMCIFHISYFFCSSSYLCLPLLL